MDDKVFKESAFGHLEATLFGGILFYLKGKSNFTTFNIIFDCEVAIHKNKIYTIKDNFNGNDCMKIDYKFGNQSLIDDRFNKKGPFQDTKLFYNLIHVIDGIEVQSIDLDRNGTFLINKYGLSKTFNFNVNKNDKAVSIKPVGFRNFNLIQLENNYVNDIEMLSLQNSIVNSKQSKQYELIF